ncbi:cadherin 23 [Sarotherodon galilaeus]
MLKTTRSHSRGIKWGGAFQDGAGSTVGKEVGQVNSFLSRAAIEVQKQVCVWRTDMLTLLALGWTKRKVEQLGRSLSQRYLKIIRILREQVESLNATKNELGVDDDTLQQWVADVQKWAEESDQTDGSLGALQARIEELVVIIRVRTQSLYRQNDSNKRRHRIRKVILDEKKRLAAAVDDYNKLAEPTNKSYPVMPSSRPIFGPGRAQVNTKRKVFEKVMAVRRLREEEMILCREMRHHWTVLRMRSVVLGTISSDSSLVGMSEDAQKGLHSLVLKKQSELKAEMLKVKDMYKRILSHQPLLEMDSEEDISDDATESDLSTSDED